ncbi:hypothetical protein AN641_04985 [Candidatus Epulonipiscioides gigas]|nr:hypothetical protein AN641_04985 [Epulopiscium sp. SCG-C07WGA-EpuloA2]
MSVVLEHFKKITSIPHGSGNEKQLSNYLVSFAQDNGLEVVQDKALNVYIYKPASEGYESSPTVILQGHMDMVCEKDKKTKFNFEKDALKLETNGDFLKAQGTTLGADDGVAIAYQMAILEDKTLKHPPLCMLMTTEEETGMGGVIALAPDLIEGKTLINLDTDNEGDFFVSCAGGVRVKLTLNGLTVAVSPGEEVYNIKVRGLKGGHSGAEIHKERANANVVIGRVLDTLNKEFNIGVCSVDGGSKDNVITREADATITIAIEKANTLKQKVAELDKILKSEYNAQDSDINISIIKSKAENKFIADTKQKLIDLLRILPNGVISKSRSIENLVETSLNIGVISTTDNTITITLSLRSSLESKKNDLKRRLNTIAKVIGVRFNESGDYPAWQYSEKSRLRDVATELYKKMYDKEANIRAVHAGLECGILSQKVDGLDMISFGPNVYDIHTPQERMSISSFERVYNFLIKMLEKLK